MFENIMNFFKKLNKKDEKVVNNSRDAAKERLHLVLMQDRANVSADFLELMKQEIIEVIKKYIDVDESAIDVRLTNKENSDGTNGAPALYANIPILNIKNEARKVSANTEKESTGVETEQKTEENKEETVKQEENQELDKKEKVEEDNKTQQQENEEVVEENEVDEKENEQDDVEEQEESVESKQTKEKIKSEN